MCCRNTATGFRTHCGWIRLNDVIGKPPATDEQSPDQRDRHGALVRKRLAALISLSSEMRVLVGFFCFSGIKALYEALTANSGSLPWIVYPVGLHLLLYRLIISRASFRCVFVDG